MRRQQLAYHALLQYADQVSRDLRISYKASQATSVRCCCLLTEELGALGP